MEPLLLNESEPEPAFTSTGSRSPTPSDGEGAATSISDIHTDSSDNTYSIEEAASNPSNVVSIDDSSVASRFCMASRGQVNGAAAFFGVTGFLLGGPIVGVVAAAGSAHFAANKTGRFANFTRRCGAYLDGLGKIV